MKYRIIEDEWRGQITGKYHKEHYPQKKTFLFGWINMTRTGFDTVEEAENYVKNFLSYPKVVKEIEI